MGFDQKNLPSIDSTLDVEVLTRSYYDLLEYPTLYDYHIIVFDVSTINAEINRIFDKAKFSMLHFGTGGPTDKELVFDSRIAESRTLFKQLVETGGFVYCFIDAETKWTGNYRRGNTVYTHNSEGTSFSWSPVQLKVVNEAGPHVFSSGKVKEYDILTDSFKEGDRGWTCYLADYPSNAKPILENRASYAIGVEIPVGKGKLVLLPRFTNLSYASKLVLEKIGLPALGVKPRSTVTPARMPWVAKFEFASKRKALETFQKTKLEIEEYQKFEPLLDGDGEELRQAVRRAFSTIGFQVTQPSESKPVQDLNLALGKWKAVVEVKGKTGDANIQDLRQLLQYLVDVRDIELKPEMDGIFVINHYCNIDAETRPQPFTEAAKELAKKHRIILLTSYDLYLAIGKVFDGKDTFDGVRTSIMQGRLGQPAG